MLQAQPASQQETTAGYTHLLATALLSHRPPLWFSVSWEVGTTLRWLQGDIVIPATRGMGAESLILLKGADIFFPSSPPCFLALMIHVQFVIALS